MNRLNKRGLVRTGIVLSLFSAIFSACGIKENQKKPVTLTIWHVYGGQTDSPLNDMIEEFNDTVGAEQGIKLQVTVVSNTNNIHDAVLRAANDEPGASELIRRNARQISNLFMRELFLIQLDIFQLFVRQFSGRLCQIFL